VPKPEDWTATNGTDDKGKADDRTRTRSPAYPAISLEEAIAKAQQLYDAEDTRFANIEAVASHWGTVINNSTFQVTLAALKHFGLIVDEGSKENRRVKLTDLGLDILLHPGDSPKRRVALETAALTPKIHRELWDKYDGKLPPDVSIRLYLLRARDGGHFNRNFVDSFIANFRSTLAFAKLDQADKISPAGDASRRDDDKGKVPDAKKKPSGDDDPPARRRVMQAGIKEDVFNLEEGPVVVQYPERLTQESFEDFESYLQLVLRRAKRSVMKDDKENRHDQLRDATNRWANSPNDPECEPDLDEK
jgi:hypothetical protein